MDVDKKKSPEKKSVTTEAEAERATVESLKQEKGQDLVADLSSTDSSPTVEEVQQEEKMDGTVEDKMAITDIETQKKINGKPVGMEKEQNTDEMLMEASLPVSDRNHEEGTHFS